MKRRLVISNSRAGFTLLELLVAAVVALLLVVLSASLLGSLVTNTASSDRRTDAFREARAAIALIQRDFTNLVPAKKAAAYLALADVSLASLTDKSLSPLRGGDEAYCLAARTLDPANATSGDVAAVGIYPYWNPAIKAFELRRFYNSPQGNLSASKLPSLRKSYHDSSASPKIALAKDVFMPVPSAAPGRPEDEVLAAYVWDVRVLALDENGNEIKSNAKTYPIIWDDANFVGPTIPTTLAISFKVVSPTAGIRLKSVLPNLNLGEPAAIWMGESSSNQRIKDAYQRYIAPNAYVFQTKVNIARP